MKATYNCPYCNVQNMVPDGSFGKRYKCHSCGSEFKIMRYAHCPHCGKKNLLTEPDRHMTYTCYNCQKTFIYKDCGCPQQPNNRSDIVVKDRTDAIVDLVISPFSAQLKAFSINGRASRAEFAGSLLVTSILCYAFIKSVYSEAEGNGGVLIFLFFLYSILSAATCMERRAHDCERENELGNVLGSWIIAALMLILLPVAVFFFFKAVVVLLFTPGVPYRNQYGDPA